MKIPRSEKLELLSPIRSVKCMRYAFHYGADAVYGGIPRYSLRVRNNELNINKLGQCIQEAHRLNKRFYVVANIIPHNNKIKTFIKDMDSIISLDPDALIVSDPGIILLIKENFPKVNIHLSVQANTTNFLSVKFWEKIGIKRIILSRELSIHEIFEIHKKNPKIELEVFIHGSLCIAYSGRCLISSYLNRKDSNQGVCDHSCRKAYSINQEKLVLDNFRSSYELEETNLDENVRRTYSRSLSIIEDRHGSYIMNSKDLCGIGSIKDLIKSGVSSFKIEGRSKSVFYCARTAQIYRKAIDNICSGREVDQLLIDNINNLSNRGYTEGFFKRDLSHMFHQNYERSHSLSITQKFVGEFTGKLEYEFAEVLVKNRFLIGDHLELMNSKKNIQFTLKKMFNEQNKMIDSTDNNKIVYISVPKIDSIDLKFAMLILNVRNK
ncbi:tRNA 5-hydroxyuridine modification protein YegQ [Candidatus Riesia pediculischaeffi]|nr:tRNA 5-hydroxyuridine modification protein YegQ [Candidatus Riesia pediculischaeffi]